MNQYHVFDEVKNTVNRNYIMKGIGIMMIPFIICFIQMNDYAFGNEYDFFTFLLGEFVMLLFVVPLLFIYVIPFSHEVKNRYIVYTRLRIPLPIYLKVKFQANIILTFCIVFLFVFVCFLFCFYLEPLLKFAQIDERFFETGNYYTLYSENSAVSALTTFFTYGSLVFGFVYSIWIALNAVLWVSFAFLLVLLIKNQYIALTMPFVFYLLQNFLFGALHLYHLRFYTFIFQFNYLQLPLFQAMTPFFMLSLIVLLLLGVTKQRIKELT